MTDINTENFEQEMKGLVMSFFSDAKLKHLVEYDYHNFVSQFPQAQSIQAQETEITKKHDYFHFHASHRSYSKELALEAIISDIKTFRFFKPATQVFWRSCEFYSAHELSSEQELYTALVRLTLEYPL